MLELGFALVERRFLLHVPIQRFSELYVNWKLFRRPKIQTSIKQKEKTLYTLLYPNLKPTERQIEYRAHPKRNLKPNVPRRFRNRAREPHLPDTRNRESERGYHRTQSSNTRRQFTRHVPDIDVVFPRVIVSKYQMFQHHNGNIRARPIPNEPKEVGERVVECVCSNN
jgi:hypothetical protein